MKKFLFFILLFLVLLRVNFVDSQNSGTNSSSPIILTIPEPLKIYNLRIADTLDLIATILQQKLYNLNLGINKFLETQSVDKVDRFISDYVRNIYYKLYLAEIASVLNERGLDRGSNTQDNYEKYQYLLKNAERAGAYKVLSNVRKYLPPCIPQQHKNYVINKILLTTIRYGYNKKALKELSKIPECETGTLGPRLVERNFFDMFSLANSVFQRNYIFYKSEGKNIGGAEDLYKLDINLINIYINDLLINLERSAQNEREKFASQIKNNIPFFVCDKWADFLNDDNDLTCLSLRIVYNLDSLEENFKYASQLNTPLQANFFSRSIYSDLANISDLSEKIFIDFKDNPLERRGNQLFGFSESLTDNICGPLKDRSDLNSLYNNLKCQYLVLKRLREFITNMKSWLNSVNESADLGKKAFDSFSNSIENENENKNKNKCIRIGSDTVRDSKFYERLEGRYTKILPFFQNTFKIIFSTLNENESEIIKLETKISQNLNKLEKYAIKDINMLEEAQNSQVIRGDVAGNVNEGSRYKTLSDFLRNYEESNVNNAFINQLKDQMEQYSSIMNKIFTDLNKLINDLDNLKNISNSIILGDLYDIKFLESKVKYGYESLSRENECAGNELIVKSINNYPKLAEVKNIKIDKPETLTILDKFLALIKPKNIEIKFK